MTITTEILDAPGPHVRLNVFVNHALCGILILRKEEVDEFVHRFENRTETLASPEWPACHDKDCRADHYEPMKPV